MEALLLNSSAVYLKWKAPALQAHNGKFLFIFIKQLPKIDTIDLVYDLIEFCKVSLTPSPLSLPLSRKCHPENYAEISF